MKRVVLTVAAFVACDDPFENAAAQVIKQAAIETSNTAGDGTTTVLDADGNEIELEGDEGT